MSTLIKLIALVIVVALLAPTLGAETQFGRVVGTALKDAAGFCDRHPDACAQAGEIARDTRNAVVSLVTTLSGEAPETLTEADRALAPPDERASPEYDAYSANNPDNRP